MSTPRARRLALRHLDEQVQACTRCPRLVAHCRATAEHPRASYRGQTYHGRGVPNFGDPDARMLIVGLAPGAHGANRTGRMFTGDRSGDFLYDVLHQAGLANQPTSVAQDDGLTLRHALITAAGRCAPPGNKPLPDELANCSEYFDRTIALLPQLKVFVCLGRIAQDALLRHGQRQGWVDKLSAYPFAHGAAAELPDGRWLLGAYHPSQQNTFTGRLTKPMLLAVFQQARQLAGLD